MDTLTADLSINLRATTLAISLEAKPDHPVAIVGPSGAGKTTILRAIAGLVSPQHGQIRCGETVFFDDARGVDVPPEQRGVGIVFQQYGLFPHLSVIDNVAFGCNGGELMVRDLLARFGIAHLADARPSSLSGGERQRVALARALASQPRILLLDEPTAALDAASRSQTMGELSSVLRHSGLPSIIVTHSFEEAAMLADEVIVIDHGAVVQRGTAHELIAAPEAAFVAQLTGYNVLVGEAGGDTEHGLTDVVIRHSGATPIVIRSTDSARGEVSVRIAPTDIVIGTHDFDGSAQNHLTGVVASIVPIANRIRLSIGMLVAEITAESCHRMSIVIGAQVTISFKATSVRLVQHGAVAPADIRREY